MKKFILASLLLSTALLAAGSAYAAPLYFPHVDTTFGWQTEIAVINTSAQTVTGTLRALGDEGQPVGTMNVTLSARGRRQIIVANEFTNHTSIRYIIFDTTSDAVQGYTKFYQEGKYRVAIPAVKEVNTSDIYIPHIDSGAQWWTGVSLVNTTSATKDLTIAFDTGQSRQITLNAYEHKAFTIASLVSNQSPTDIQSAVITNASGVIGLELFGNNWENQMEGILLTDKTASILYYPYVASDGLWWTGIVAYNPLESECTITITPYNSKGTPLSSSTHTIAGKAKYVGTVAALDIPAQTAWFKIESTNHLSGFELVGTNYFDIAGYAGNGGTGSKAGVFPKIEKNGGWSAIALINTESNSGSVTFTAYTDDGNRVGSQVVLPIGGYTQIMNAQELNFLLHIPSATYIAYSADRNVVGFQLNGSADYAMLDGLPGLGVTGDGGNMGGGGAVDMCSDGYHCVSPFTCNANSECECPAGQQLCGLSCIPAGAGCCPDGSYCESPQTCASDNTCTSDGSVFVGVPRHMFANGCSGGVIYGYNGPNYTVCQMYLNSASSCSKVINDCHSYY